MNITKIVDSYVNEHPSVKDCLKKGLINYSKLARLISKDENLNEKKHFDALLIACRRAFEKLKKYESQEKRIISVLSKSKIEMKNKICVFVLEKAAYLENLLNIEREIKKKGEVFHIIEGASGITLITSVDFSSEILKLFKGEIITHSSDLVEVTIRSPKEIEDTPGVVTYLYSLFGEHGINIIETMSCWTDTIFVLSEKDAGKVMWMLKF